MESADILAHLGQCDDTQLLAVIDAALDVLTDERLRLPTDRQLLNHLDQATRLQARITCWQHHIAATTEDTQAAWHEHATSTRTYLSEHLNETPKHAAHMILAGRQLDQFPILKTAAATGRILPDQTQAITTVLTHLPPTLGAHDLRSAQTTMVDLAATHNATELHRLSQHLLKTLAPDQAEQLEAERLEAEHRRATRTRYLGWHHDHHGSVVFHASLPVADAQPLLAILDSYLATARHGIDHLDPDAEHLTAPMRRADALLAMTHHHQQHALAPTHGGDRPRVVISLRYEDLHAQAHRAGGFTAAGRLSTGEPITPSVLRRWLCDADILPVVLGGDSQILDVGRTRRLVTPAIRTALEQRDQGCVFPGCDAPPRDCHAHHILPWWAGGTTTLDNLTLVCPHHHGIVEPGHDPTTDRWHIRIRPDGLPETIPPSWVDPRQQPRLHARHQRRRIEAGCGTVA